MTAIKPLLLALSARSCTFIWRLLGLIVALPLILTACVDVGSDSISAGVGTGGSGLVVGSVSGFGSVIINGVRYDDLQVGALRTNSDGTTQNTALKLGQRVQLMYRNNNVATTVEVVPQLIGPVTKLPQTINGVTEFQLLGQWVRVISDSTDPQNALTLFEGLSDSSAITGTHELEIHGSWLFDSAKSSYVLVATRIELLTTSSDPVLISGVAQAVPGNSLRLNHSSGTWITNTAFAVAPINGDLVRVWLRRADAISTALVAQAIVPTRAENRRPQLQAGSQVLNIHHSAPISRVDNARRTIEIEGQTYPLPANANSNDYRSGQYIRVQRRSDRDENDESDDIQQRDANDDDDDNNLGHSTQLQGTVTQVDWQAQTVQFRLRGVSVEVARTVLPASCLAFTGASTVVVHVGAARPDRNGVVRITRSTQITCQAAANLPSGIVERKGQIASVSSNQLRLTNGLVAQWDQRTVFQIRLPLRVGDQVELEGYFVGTVLQLRKVELDD